MPKVLHDHTHEVDVAFGNRGLFKEVYRLEFYDLLFQSVWSFLGPVLLLRLLDVYWEILKLELQVRVAFMQKNEELANIAANVAHGRAFREISPWIVCGTVSI